MDLETAYNEALEKVHDNPSPKDWAEYRKLRDELAAARSLARRGGRNRLAPGDAVATPETVAGKAGVKLEEE